MRINPNDFFIRSKFSDLKLDWEKEYLNVPRGTKSVTLSFDIMGPKEDLLEWYRELLDSPKLYDITIGDRIFKDCVISINDKQPYLVEWKNPDHCGSFMLNEEVMKEEEVS